jgi:hypothetical protein
MRFNNRYLIDRIDLLNNDIVIRFINTFVICEYIYKTLYQLKNGKSNYIKLHMGTVKSLFKQVGFTDDKKLQLIFGGMPNSFKIKRNKILHSISRKTIYDIKNNGEEYIEIMEMFVMEIKNLTLNKTGVYNEKML